MLRSSPICLFVTEYPTNRYFCISTNWYLYICVNFFFLSEDRKWWEPLQQFVWPNICNWLCILGIHAKISKRWKDHAFKVVQAWFNFEATKTRESLMKCEMSTNVRKNVVSLRKIQGKAPRNYFCKLPDMFSVTETNGCTREQSQADCEHILFQYITVWQCVTLSSLSVMINSAGGPCPCLRTGPLYYCDSCKPGTLRSSGRSTGLRYFEETTSLWTRARRAAALQPPVRQGWRSQPAQGTEAWRWILLCVRAQGARTQLEKDSTFNHKTNFSFEPHQLIVSKQSKN